MYSDDIKYKDALKRMFSTTFFGQLDYKNTFTRPSSPVYLSSLAGTGSKVKDNYHVVYFYNRKINIDFDNTIIVKEESGKITYDFYNNLPEKDRLYNDIYIENGNKRIYVGTKFKEIIS